MTETYKGLERRKHSRSSKRVSLLYRAAEGSDLDHLSEPKNSVTENTGRGGFCFQTEIYVPPGSILEVQINDTLDSDELKAALPVHAHVRVVWVKQVDAGKYRLGVQSIATHKKRTRSESQSE
jgi:hypothetical protein